MNPNSRLEAFCDGVFAIALTLLIIDVKLPATASISTTADLWRALEHLLPSVCAFLLSFGIILVTWVNHHAMLELLNRSSTSFIYANGLLLLTVAFTPFPTSLVGEFVLTDHAAPAVFLYNAVLTVQAFAWIVVSDTALKNHLTKHERAVATVRESRRNGYGAVVLYGLLAVAALWWPFAVAIVTTMSWMFWLALGIRMKRV